MSRLLRPAPLLAALIALAASGCESSLVPRAVLGTYALRTLGGSELPVAVVFGPGDSLVYLADTVRIVENRRAERALLTRRVDPSRGSVVTNRSATRYVFELRGDSVRFLESSSLCPGTDPRCTLLTRTGRFIDGGLRIDGGPQGEWAYARVGGT